ncbi:uncharacterized protein C6orf136 homolog isoform X3 [Pteropus alecto]|uniref:uncharacterized protein C6orf136 homolog isoform X3 n=1 Tax=Pteropus alecto TaxID=9402 RepID=UPI0007689759|nr:uncharacterized protein C6orf136 homolog isoform X3 [Pteropus alecto]
MSFLPALGWAGGIEGRAFGCICTSPASLRLPVSRGMTPLTVPEEAEGLVSSLTLADLFTAISNPSGDPSMEEHLAVMYERLRQELPNLFLHSHDYTLYSSDVEFINEILNIRTKGRTWYILSLTLCRFLAWNYFAQLRLEVLQLTRHPENWTLQARWRLVGLPIHMLFLRFYKRDKEELYRTYDAYSTFYLNSNGLICRHRLDKLMPSHSPPTPVKKLLVGALVTLGLSEPEPNLHLCPKA